MNNGYQKSNGCGADKKGGKIFNTFFYPELQSKHVRPLATNITVNDRDRTRKAYAEAFITLYGSAAAQGYTYEEIVGFIAEKHRLNAEEVFKNEMKIKTVHENSH